MCLNSEKFRSIVKYSWKMFGVLQILRTILLVLNKTKNRLKKI